MNTAQKNPMEKLILKGTGLSPEQLKVILNLNTFDGVLMKEKLSEKKFENPEEILAEICKNLSMSFLNHISVNEIPTHLIQNLPITYAKSHEILPFKEEENKIEVLISNPLNLKALDDLKILFEKPVEPIVTTSQKLQDAINRVYEKNTTNLAGLDEIEEEEYDLDDPVIDLLETESDEAPVIKLVNTLLFRSVKEKASDIHIEPYEKEMVVRFRVDGVLNDVFKPPKRLQNSITSRIKVMANLNIAEKRLPQDGRIPLKLAGKDIDVRVNTVPTAYGERIVLRLQDRSKVVLALDQLGFSKRSLNHFYDLVLKSYGIILVTGPTGSGKSTTLYACLSQINSVDKNIITVENPVEQRIHGIGQIQVNHKIGLTFAHCLRAILRQDPNVIMIGEIRDLETAEIAINASLTGHLVFATIHTNDSSGAFPRLIDMGCEPFLIATSLLGVSSQRLVRLLCPNCKQPHNPSQSELQSLGLSKKHIEDTHVHKAVGCSKCHQGYLGRTMIEELLLINDSIRSLIMQKQDSGTIRKKAIEDGMPTFREHGIQKVLEGVTSLEEVIANTQEDL